MRAALATVVASGEAEWQLQVYWDRTAQVCAAPHQLQGNHSGMATTVAGGNKENTGSDWVLVH